MLGKTCSVNIENARALYGEIVDEVRQQDLLADEQAGALPVAEIGNGKPLGEVKLVRQADDYRVVWSPPEMNVGSDADSKLIRHTAAHAGPRCDPVLERVCRICQYQNRPYPSHHMLPLGCEHARAQVKPGSNH